MKQFWKYFWPSLEVNALWCFGFAAGGWLSETGWSLRTILAFIISFLTVETFKLRYLSKMVEQCKKG